MVEGNVAVPQATEDTIAKKLHSIAQYILVGVFGLLPILFLPMFEFSLGYTKTFIVIVATFFALTLYGFAVLRTGKFAVSLPLPLVGLWLLVVAGAASAFVSGDVRDAFFGDFMEHQTVAFLATLALVATVVMHVLTDKRMIYRLYMLLSVSTIVLAVFHISRVVFGPGFLSFGIFGNQIATPVGSWNDLAIFFGLTIILSIVALEQLTLTKQGRALFGSVVVVALAMLGIVNFSPVWFVLGIVSLIVLIYSLARDKMTPKWLESALPERGVSMYSLGVAGLVFLISFIFIAGGSVIGSRISAMTGISYVEVRPSIQATSDIVRDVYKTDAVFGVGPNKFVDAWRLHRDPSLNNTIFWNTDFVASVGYIPTFFITMGLIGGLLWIAFLFFFVQAGMRMLLRVVADPDRTWYFIGSASFVTGLYLWIMSIIYVPGPLLILTAAACTGLMLTARNALEPHRERMIVMNGDRRSGFLLVSVVMLVVIVSLAGLYTVGRHYASAYMFASGERALVSGNTAESKRQSLEASTLLSDDRYLRRVAEIEYSELMITLNLPPDTENLEIRFRDALRNGVIAAGRATALDSTDANNWSVLGAIYSAVVPLEIEGAYDRAKEALEKARSLDPQNPIRTLMLARLAYSNGSADEARTLMNDAIRQKPDYIDAAFLLSQLEIAEGNIDAALESTKRIIQLEPQNPARYFQLGVLELAKGNTQGGIIALETALALDPQYANARYYLAFAYDSEGRGSDAKMQLEKVLETNQDNAEIKMLLERMSRGEKISQPQQPPAQQQVTTTAESQSVGTVSENPDSPLLTPVNPVPDTPKSAEEAERE